MNGSEDARYRLLLARRSLDLAEEQLLASRWREAALFGRAAIEHGVKGLAACFGPVPRSHEPGLVLGACLGEARFPAGRVQRATSIRPELDSYGMGEHLLLSYGDERSRIDPWSLVTEERATRAVDVARETLSLAEDCVTDLFGPART